MTIKLNALDRWHPLPAGNAVKFQKISDNGRTVRLIVNCAAQTTFHVEDEMGPRLLVTVPAGLETIEFSAAGEFAVFADEAAGEVHYQTAEGEPTFATIVDPVIFTRIATRRARNPEMEELMHRMQANMERRLAQQSTEFEAALERHRSEATNGRPAEAVQSDAPGTAASHDGTEVRPPEPPQPKPVEEAGGENGGQ